MTKENKATKVSEAVNLLSEGDIDLSNVLGKGGLVKELSKAILERALKAETDEHLGYVAAMTRMPEMAATIRI